MFLDSLLFSMNVTLPTILMLSLGMILRRRRMVDDHFCQMGSKLVFNVALPALLFMNIVKHPADFGGQVWLVGAGVSGTVAVYLISEWIATRYIRLREYRGLFVQGMFRGNTGILGLALSINAYGVAATAPASVYTACITLLFNVLAVITLTHSLSENKLSWGNIALSLAKNPLIVAILLGLLVSQLHIPLPTALLNTGDYIAYIALPLALICAGASLNFSQLRRLKQATDQARLAGKVVWWGSLGRLVITPVFMVLLGKFIFQLPPMELGVVFLMSSTPLASASYAMVVYFKGDAVATANMIGTTNLGYMMTSGLGIFILRQIGWI